MPHLPMQLTPFRPPTFILACALLGLIAWGPVALEAQEFSGRVVDATTGEPIEGAVLRTTPGDFVEVSRSDGTFDFFLLNVDFPVDVTVERASYSTITTRVDASLADLDIQLDRAPIALAGVSTELTFEDRYSALERTLDRRFGDLIGIFRAVDRDVIAQFDSAHESDSYAMISSALELWWDFDEQRDIMRSLRTPGGRAQFEIYLDDSRVPLTALTGTPNESLCRAEVFQQAFFNVTEPKYAAVELNAPPQLRAYTCSYMARVAGGLEPMPDRLCFGAEMPWEREPVFPDFDGRVPTSRSDMVRLRAARNRGEVIPPRSGASGRCVELRELSEIRADAAR